MSNLKFIQRNIHIEPKLNYYETPFVKEFQKDYQILEVCSDLTSPKRLKIFCTKCPNRVGIYCRDEFDNILIYKILFLNDISDQKKFIQIFEKILKMHAAFNMINYDTFLKNISIKEIKIPFSIKDWHLKKINENEFSLESLIEELDISINHNKRALSNFIDRLPILSFKLSKLRIDFLKEIGFDISLKRLQYCIERYAKLYIKKYEYYPKNIHEVPIHFFNIKRFRFEKMIQSFNFSLLGHLKSPTDLNQKIKIFKQYEKKIENRSIT